MLRQSPVGTIAVLWRWAMKSVREMSLDEFGQHVMMLAHGFAAEFYKRRNPGVSEDDAWKYAGRYWKTHVNQVLDFLAISGAAHEEASPESN
jgi:hypothetical protein